jgi:CheY-like chemotaxis protein
MVILLGSIDGAVADARERATGRHRGVHESSPVAGHSARAGRSCDDHGMRRTVLIVDDHDDFRQAAADLLASEGFDVVGGAADGKTAIEAVERLRPDMVLLDVQLPDLDGFAVADRLAASPDPPLVVLISSRDAAVYGSRIESAPALGFLAKRELSGAALAALVD